MKKTLLSALFILATLVMGTHVSAVSLFDQGISQHYTIQQRSDNKTIVYGTILLTAQNDSERASYKFTLPTGVEAANLTVQQMLAKSNKSTCKVYETFDDWLTRRGYADAESVPSYAQPYEDSRKCIEYETETTYNADYDYSKQSIYYTGSESYYSYIHPSSSFDYKDLEITQDGSSYTAKLAEPIAAGKQGAVILSYTSDDYTSGFLGYYTYKFRTLVSDETINNTTVTVQFDDDLYSRQASQKRSSDTTALEQQSNTTAGPSSISDSASKAARYNDEAVVQGGYYTQSQGRMLPGDTLEVSGSFATKKFLLYGKQFLIGVVLIALAVAAFFGYKRYRRKHPRAQKTQYSSVEAHTGVANFSTIKPSGPLSGINLLTIAVVSTVVAALVVTVILLVSQYAIISSTTGPVVVLALLPLFCFTLIICPGLYVWRADSKQLLAWSLIQTATIFVLLLLFVLVVSALTDGDMYY